jgi:hypothetical protein
MIRNASMHDSELKKLLIETHPIRPGQEERAWSQLRDRSSFAGQLRSISIYASWRSALTVCSLIVFTMIVGDFAAMRSYSTSFASAASQVPGIYATAFYSHTAHAQVIWLNGLEPASDKLTYLDPTTVIAGAADSTAPQPAGDPNGL